MNRVPVEEYKGYVIIEHRNTVEYTSYFCVYDGKVPLSTMALNSVQAAKNVIDTHERALVEKK